MVFYFFIKVAYQPVLNNLKLTNNKYLLFKGIYRPNSWGLPGKAAWILLELATSGKIASHFGADLSLVDQIHSL